MSVRHLALAFSAVFGFTALASATPITYNYTGTMVSATDIFAGQGSNVTGTFTFDDALVDLAAGGIEDIFRANTAANLSFNDVWEITLKLGTAEVTTATNARAAGSLHHVLNLTDAANVDQFSMEALAVSLGDDSARLLMFDAPPGTPTGVTPGTANLTSSIAGDIPILNSLDPANFEFTVGQSFWTARNNQTGTVEGTLSFTLTSISPAQAVPEPATLLLFGTGLAAAGIRRYRRKQ